MARKPRSIRGGLVYHVMNRASARAQCFQTEGDYAAFERVLDEAVERFGMRLLSYVVMPNHFHLVVWPRRGQGETLSRFMQWLQQTHTQRWHAHYHNAGTGRLYQGRFKAFAVQAQWHAFAGLLRVCRYVERNPVRAKLARRGDQWRWSSCWCREKGSAEDRRKLAAWPEGSWPGERRWLALVNRGMPAAEEEAVRVSMGRERPLGSAAWTRRMVEALGLEHTVRARGRPRKEGK